MNTKINRLIMLNQMAGPLFRELAEDLAPLYESGCVLVTGHPDTVALKVGKESKLVIKSAPCNMCYLFLRASSWLELEMVYY
jgi:hypothetical protein